MQLNEFTELNDMNTSDFDELAGRIEGIGRTLMLLIVEAQESEAIDDRFTHRLHSLAESLSFDRPHLEATKRTVLETALALDGARKIRHKRKNLKENQTR
jgi:hypothetical protein